MLHSLPGITRVAYTQCNLLPPDISLRALAGVPVGVYTTVTDIPLYGEAECELETQFDNNSLVEKVKLTFSTLDDLPLFRQLAFVIFTANGEIFLIGTKELPYPSVKLTRSTGTPDGEPSVRKYEVSLTGRKALVLCAV